MCDFKNHIFKLIQKCPDYIYIWDKVQYEIAYYPGSDICYRIHFKRHTISEEQLKYFVELIIQDPQSSFAYTIELNEKEYMELVWKIEDWYKSIESRVITGFEDFVYHSPDKMDDLLDD